MTLAPLPTASDLKEFAVTVESWPTAVLSVAPVPTSGGWASADIVVDGVLSGILDWRGLGRLLAAVSLMYVGASLFNWIQGSLTAGAVQGVMYRLRASVEDKLHRLPATYFQERSRGDVLSRATNDIDNIAQALSQALTQLIMSVLMLCGALAMMLWISPLLAVASTASR